MVTYMSTQSEKSSNISYDDISSSQDYYSDEEVDLLEEYIKLSKELDKINDKTKRDKESSDNKLLSPDELNKGIEEDSFCECELTKQEKLVNQYIYDGYELLSSVGLNLLKSKIVDAFSLPSSAYSSIKFDNQANYKVYDGNHNYEISFSYDGENYEFKLRGKYKELLNTVYILQHKGVGYTKNIKNSNEYNKERNKLLDNAIDLYKKILNDDVELKHGKIK